MEWPLQKSEVNRSEQSLVQEGINDPVFHSPQKVQCNSSDYTRGVFGKVANKGEFTEFSLLAWFFAKRFNPEKMSVGVNQSQLRFSSEVGTDVRFAAKSPSSIRLKQKIYWRTGKNEKEKHHPM